MGRNWVADVLDVLWPTECAGCGGARWGGDLWTWCAPCVEGLPKGLWPLRGLPEEIRSGWAYGSYEGPVGQALRRGKYRPDPRAILELGRLVAAAAPPQICDMDVVIGVPQSARRTRSRGFSPVGILSRELASTLGLPEKKALERRGGKSQASLSRADRRDNVASAFLSTQEVAGEAVLLVDDVITSGETAAACARALLDAGAHRVSLLAVASPRI